MKNDAIVGGCHTCYPDAVKRLLLQGGGRVCWADPVKLEFARPCHQPVFEAEDPLDPGAGSAGGHPVAGVSAAPRGPRAAGIAFRHVGTRLDLFVFSFVYVWDWQASFDDFF